jgi:hypothetical protein
VGVEETDDSIVRAVAAAPPRHPPKRLVAALVARADETLLEALAAAGGKLAESLRPHITIEDGMLVIALSLVDAAVGAEVARALHDREPRAHLALAIDVIAGGGPAAMAAVIARARSLVTHKADGIVVDRATASYLEFQYELRRSEDNWIVIGKIAGTPLRRAGGLRSDALRIGVAALVLAVLIAAVILVHAIAKPIGRPVTDWTPRPTDVGEPAPFALETNLRLNDDERGQPLTLHLDCYHGPLALFVDGVQIADVGEIGVGEHRHVIAAMAATRSHIQLTLVAPNEREWRGFAAPPYLAVGTLDRSAIATLNRHTSLALLVLATLFAFLSGVLYVVDHRRREYFASFSGSFGLVFVTLYALGLMPAGEQTNLARAAPAVLGVSLSAIFLTVLYSVFQAFDLHRPRLWIAISGSLAAFGIAGALAHPLLLLWTIALTLVPPAFSIYLIGLCLRVARDPAHRTDAWIILAWACVQTISSLLDSYWLITGINFLGGLHTRSFSFLLLVAAQTTILIRYFVARQQMIERAADELRRQVGERSQQLANALAKLSQQPARTLVVGRIIDGRYRVIRQLGAGGMGTVYEVERISDGQQLALKTVRERVDAKLMARFAREAQLAAELDHANLLPVIDVGIADGILFLVMELVDGGSLEDQRGRFGNAGWVASILTQTATGLAEMHARGIVHRDLKPSNILLSRGVARIADFGLAALHEEHQVGAFDDTSPNAARLTKMGEVFGTPLYMAPELADGAAIAAPSADIFSFGVVAYELVSGRSPFVEPAVVARLNGRSVVAAPLPDLDDSLRALIEHCLEFDPARRPTAAQLVATLRVYR